MNLEIPGLHRITEEEKPKMYETLVDSMTEYPKQAVIFPKIRDRLNSIAATIYFYGAYDFYYGAAFSTDTDIKEVAMVVYSEDMDLSEERYEEAGCYNENYLKAIGALTEEQQKLREGFFDELDRLEATLDFPQPHLYIDFVGVAGKYQGQGRGHRLVEPICRYADETGLPLVLFTNSPEDIRFYQSMGFGICGIVESKEYGFVNTYMLYIPS